MTQQVAVIQQTKIHINIIIIKYNLILLKLITKAGIFYKFFFINAFYFINCQRALFIKNTFESKIKANTYLHFLLKNVLPLFHNMRYYLKLKGLGFFVKYIVQPQHILFLNIGFSKGRYVKIPQQIAVVRKPRKKKYIFILISSNIVLLSNFTSLIRTLKVPDPYKIKGFRYLQESIILKVGKKKK